jgi:lysophospholipid acyltransferase (LPLAT)-like uncharacterized protein
MDNPTIKNDMDVNNIIRRRKAKGGKTMGEEDGEIMEAKDGKTIVTMAIVTTSKLTIKTKTFKQMEIPCVFATWRMDT